MKMAAVFLFIQSNSLYFFIYTKAKQDQVMLMQSRGVPGHNCSLTAFRAPF
jgi:hypothetical protein